MGQSVTLDATGTPALAGRLVQVLGGSLTMVHIALENVARRVREHR